MYAPTLSTSPEPGYFLAGDDGYDLTFRETLGEGTYGIVYAVETKHSSERCVLKRNLADKRTDFMGAVRELDLLRRLRGHPHIVQMRRAVLGQPFEGGNFPQSRSKKYKDDSVHFLFERAERDLDGKIFDTADKLAALKRIFAHVLLAIEYMRAKGIIHRDLKPNNILLFPGNVGKVCDLGLAKPFTTQGSLTPDVFPRIYEPPEIMRRDCDYDYEVDVWAAGCIFYELAADRPFQRERMAHKRAPEIIERRLAKLPDRMGAKRLLDFGGSAGSSEEFIDLLRGMLAPTPTSRLTATGALDHRFFAFCRHEIDQTRRNWPPTTDPPPRLCISPADSRLVAGETAVALARGRHRDWFSMRALFQGLDIFDRYLAATPSARTMSPETAEFHFFVCFYLAVKYFSTVYAPPTFRDVLPRRLQKANYKARAGKFERHLVVDVLKGAIYRPTLFEAADHYDGYMPDAMVDDLLRVFALVRSYSGKNIERTFELFCAAAGLSAFDCRHRLIENDARASPRPEK